MLEKTRARLSREMEAITGGELIARMLKAEGVDTVFGIIDGTYFGLYSAFPALGIRLISPRHETCAAHMAGAYARLTGKLGVCIASNGPGVANLLPGLVVENAEGNRVLAITSARREGTIAPDRGGTYQSFPQVEVTAPMTKWSVRVPSLARLPELTRRAFRESWTGRPGVVHLDVPDNVMNGRAKLKRGWQRAPSQYRATDPLHASPEQVKRAADVLLEAEAPAIHAGSGVIHAQAWAEVEQLAELLELPVTCSWGARGAFDERKAWAIPMTAMELNARVHNEADLVLVLGSRLGETDWWGKAPYWARPSRQRMIQVDIDATRIGVNRPVELAIIADVRSFLSAVIEEVRPRLAQADRAARRTRLERYRADRTASREKLDAMLEEKGSPLHPAHVGSLCRRAFADDAIVVFDGGNANIWGQFFHEVRVPNTVLWTPKFGMLGAGVAQALGAKVAHPDREVYCITGDGAMGFHPQEIETAVRSGLPVVYVVMCDRQWGMTKINQNFSLKPIETLVRKHLDPDDNINTDFSETRFDRLAEAMGAHGERASSPDELAAAIQRCLALQLPSVIQVDVDPVKHLWAPGLRHFKAMHEEPAG